jgi:aryl-alcohol dehydrogenase
MVRAAVVKEVGAPFEVTEVEIDDPRPGEVQVRMTATGVCHTDAIMRGGWMPFGWPGVLGHEGAGVVEKVGAGVQSVVPGDHVVLAPAYCGHCEQCLSGHPSYCLNSGALTLAGARSDGSTSFSLDGQPVASHFFGQSSFAALTNAYESSVVKVDESVPLDILGPLGCGIQTGAGSVLNVLRPETGSSIAIFGTGAVGSAALLAARAAGCTTIIMVDIVELGATHVVNSKEEDPVAKIREITGGAGVKYALDTTGNKFVFPQLLASVGTRGHAGLVGAAPLGTEVGIDVGSLLFTGLQLSMILEGDSEPQVFIPRLIEMYKAGIFPFDKLISFYDVDQIEEAFADSERGEALKPVLRW